MSAKRTADDEEVVELDMPRPRSISRKPLGRTSEPPAPARTTSRRRESDAQQMQKMSMKADDEALANITRDVLNTSRPDAEKETQPEPQPENQPNSAQTSQHSTITSTPKLAVEDDEEDRSRDQEFHARMAQISPAGVEEVLQSIRSDPDYSIQQDIAPAARTQSQMQTAPDSSEKNDLEPPQRGQLESEDAIDPHAIASMLADMRDNPTHDQQYMLHQGSRGISPPPGFDDETAIPSYHDSSEIPSYQNVVSQSSTIPVSHSAVPSGSNGIMPESERPAMTEKFMNAHIARHGASSLSPMALLTPDQADALPEYVMTGIPVSESQFSRGRDRGERSIINSAEGRERAKLENELEAVRQIEEQEALQAIEAMEALSLVRGSGFSAEQLTAMQEAGDEPTDYYTPDELAQFRRLDSEPAEEEPELSNEDAELMQMMSQYIRRSPSEETQDAAGQIETDASELASILRDRELTQNARSGQDVLPVQAPQVNTDPAILTMIQQAMSAPKIEVPKSPVVAGSAFANPDTRTGIDVEALKNSALARREHEAEALGHDPAPAEQMQSAAGYGGGHNVKRTTVDAATYAMQQVRNAKKAEAYAALANQVNALRAQNNVSREAFDLTTKLLLLNPEYYTIWNYRREIMLQGLFPMLDDIGKQELLVTELKRLQSILQDFPKVYWIWTHRKWCLSVCPWPDWQRELLLVSKMLEQDARNFHVWEYRRYVVAQIEAAEEATKAEREFEYTTAAINANFSNFSAWHNRTKLIPQILLSIIDEEQRRDRRREMLRQELELIKNAIYTDPDDQSVWLYHRWLLNPESAHTHLHPLAPTTRDEHVHHLAQELAMIEELMEEVPDNVWCTYAKVHYTLSLQRLTDVVHSLQQQEELHALISVLEQNDALREGRYRDWRHALTL